MIAIAALFFGRRTQTWLNRQKLRGYIYHCVGSVICVSPYQTDRYAADIYISSAAYLWNICS